MIHKQLNIVVYAKTDHDKFKMCFFLQEKFGLDGRQSAFKYQVPVSVSYFPNKHARSPNYSCQ